MPPVAAIAAAVLPTIGAAAAGVAGLAAGAASVVGAVGGGLLSAAGGIASGVLGGAGSLLFGAPPTLEAMAMPAYYDTAGVGILGGVVSAASRTVVSLGKLFPAAMGIYQQIAPPTVETLTPATKVIPSVPAPAVARTALPVLGTQAPMVMTVGAVAKPEPNYLLYAGLAALAYFLLGKK